MNMKSFRRLREHPGICPLGRPQPDPLEDAFIAPDELGEKTAMPLAMNRSRKNLHARNRRVARIGRSVIAMAKASRLFA
jgi:hypothetical protein